MLPLLKRCWKQVALLSRWRWNSRAPFFPGSNWLPMAQPYQRPKILRPSGTLSQSQKARNNSLLAHARRVWSCCPLSRANAAARFAGRFSAP